MEAYRLTATQILMKFADGSMTIEDYVRSLLARIEERDDTVRAWTYLDRQSVIENARKLDQVPQGERGPLHGLPIAVKDIVYTKDMPTQYNSPIYMDHAPQVDAASVAILRHAGALLLGKSTTTEFACTNVGPKTRNPHGPDRTPGGSSSGSGAAVGDFQVPIGVGTQTGGSVIRPASFNGIYGFKPTWNSISREGQKIWTLLFDTFGFFTRSVKDLELLADVFALQDDEAPPEHFEVKGARFATLKTTLWPKAGPGTRTAMERGAQLLRDHGAQVEEIELPPEFDHVSKYHKIICQSEGRVSFLPEYKIAKDKLSPYIASFVENSEKVSRSAQLEAFDSLAALRPKFDKIAERYVAILTPSVPDVAPLGIENTGSASFNKIWTALHVPVVNVPGFKGEVDMPIGLSLVAPRYRDRHLLTVTKAVGRIFEAEGGWKPKNI